MTECWLSESGMWRDATLALPLKFLGDWDCMHDSTEKIIAM